MPDEDAPIPKLDDSTRLALELTRQSLEEKVENRLDKSFDRWIKRLGGVTLAGILSLIIAGGVMMKTTFSSIREDAKETWNELLNKELATLRTELKSTLEESEERISERLDFLENNQLQIEFSPPADVRTIEFRRGPTTTTLVFRKSDPSAFVQDALELIRAGQLLRSDVESAVQIMHDSATAEALLSRLAEQLDRHTPP